MNKKIVHVQVIPKLSGVQRVSLDILSHLDKEYQKFIIFGGGYTIEEALLKECEKNNIKIIIVNSLRREICLTDLKAFYDLYKIFRKEKFDIIHTNSTKPGIVARIAAKAAGCKKIVHTVHGIAFHKHQKIFFRIFYFLIEAFSCLFSDYLITVNKFYLKYYPHIRQKKAVHNSINFSGLHPCNKEINEVICFGFMSRLDVQKDPLTLCKAVRFALNNNFFKEKNIKIIIGGDGELKKECLDYVQKNNMDNIFEFVGWVTDKDNFYNRIDVFCLPSIYEAFGLVLLEAAFFSKPSIASNVEGIPEIIKDSYNGLLFNPTDYEGLAYCLKKYIDNKTLIKEHGENSNRNLLDNFKFDEMINEYKYIYEKL
ncbi:glycosyltransferase family 4 protein [Mixta sp. Marseille-Q2659]|uniref:glycosyltransferase family 4 protein n=1 Tax=Mixta sp. Marseille-Q2659 TaxID=2736607 RepID=UPI0023B8E3CD|nr:glycosyltransferase family 4 protein [Mixta sp. Marseille-Q2659]